MSISKGDVSPHHNMRDFIHDEDDCPNNIDFDRIGDNVVLVNKSFEKVYAEAFGEALERYNQGQVEKGHKERQIPNYLAHVEADKKLNVAYEYVIQCGNEGNKLDRKTATEIYGGFVHDFQRRFGQNFVVAQAVIHVDEATPHMHFEIVPRAESKRGLAVQNSLNKAIKQAGFNDYKDMLAAWDSMLERGMESHGLRRVPGDKEKQLGGVDIHTFKRTKEFERKERAKMRAEKSKHEREVAELTDIAEKTEAQLDDMTRQVADVSIDLEQKTAQAQDAESRLADATSELEDIKIEQEYESLRLERLRRSRDRMESSVGALQERVSAEVAEATIGKPGYADSPRWDALAIEQCDQECLGALGELDRTAGELDRATRELAETRESLAGRIAALVERLTQAIVDKLGSGDWNPAHVRHNVGKEALDALGEAHHRRIDDAKVAATERWEARRAELKPQMDVYEDKINQRFKDFRRAAKEWQAEGMTGDKPVFKLIKIPPDLAKYYEMEVWEVRTSAKDRAARAKVKYGLETPVVPSSSPLPGGYVAQPQQRRPEPQVQQQQQQRRNVPTR